MGKKPPTSTSSDFWLPSTVSPKNPQTPHPLWLPSFVDATSPWSHQVLLLVESQKNSFPQVFRDTKKQIPTNKILPKKHTPLFYGAASQSQIQLRLSEKKWRKKKNITQIWGSKIVSCHHRIHKNISTWKTNPRALKRIILSWNCWFSCKFPYFHINAVFGWGKKQVKPITLHVTGIFALHEWLKLMGFHVVNMQSRPIFSAFRKKNTSKKYISNLDFQGYPFWYTMPFKGSQNP